MPGGVAASQAGMRRHMILIDSMTEEEKDMRPSDFNVQNSKIRSRINRICRGSGVSADHFMIFVRNMSKMAATWKRHGGLGKMEALMKQPKGLVGQQRQNKQLQKVLSPEQVSLLGGIQGARNILFGADSPF